jgi:uncharacterized membrane protein YhaH (DUF805 family)
MSFGDAISTCFRKYVEFKGRAGRSEYWYWVLFTILAGFAAGFLDAVVRSGNGSSTDSNTGPLAALVSLVTFLPSIAVTVRRLHDTGRSGWWYLWFFLAFIVLTVMLVFGLGAGDDGIGIAVLAGVMMFALFVGAIALMATVGEPHANRFGPPVVAAAPDTYTGAPGADGDRRFSRGPRSLGPTGGASTSPGTHWVLSGFDSNGNVVRLTPDFSTGRTSFVIGRNSADCDLVISDDGVSRRHAELSMTSAGFTIRDLGSANGTTLDGRPVPSTHAVPMPSTGTLRVGPVDLGIFGS